jgi:hypothetical protein
MRLRPGDLTPRHRDFMTTTMISASLDAWLAARQQPAKNDTVVCVVRE